MAKLALLLSLLANGLAGYLLLDRSETASASPVAAPTANVAVDAISRRLQEEVQRSLSTQADRILRELDIRLKRLTEERDQWTVAMKGAQKHSENAARENTGKLEELDQVLGSQASTLEKAAQSLEALAAKVKALEARPVAVAAAPGTPGPAKPAEPPPVAPGVPALPGAPEEPPDVIKGKVDKALADLDQGDPDKVYPAILVVKKYRAMEAVPRLVKLFHPTPYDDVFTRLAAVEALGDMRACDAVPALAEALVDRAMIVSQQASKSLRLITERDTGLSPQARVVERRKVRGEILEWWGNHEDEVRARLKQPKGGSAPAK